ncbi:cytochrome P450 [Saliphagus sp. LR7]|uniref:cytochrome P450 n=1 Tax=Saliphagus sp. LR7 TaxID=2282654 RepID=UPI000DF79E5A|nr:cytochrome P450 [Saliphagus sp. LR7]
MANRFPRPPAPSGDPVLGHTLDFARSPFEFVNRAIGECGDVYRMELPTVDVYVLAHPDYFRQALVDNIDAFGKTADFQRVFRSGLLSTEGQQWKQQRTVLQPLFHPKRIQGYTDQMVDATYRRIETWSAGEVRNMESEMQDLTLEVLFSTLFGRELLPGEGQELRKASDGLNKWFQPTSWLLPNWVPTPARREFRQSAERLRNEVRRLLAEHDGTSGTSEEGSATLLSKLSEASEDGALSRTEIEDQMLTMIFAGYETTAAALGFAWYALATNPAVRQRFHDELETVLGGEPPTLEDVDDLEFTDRIITETMRKYPPIHTIPRQATRDVRVGEYWIPANEEVHLSVLAVHRDDRFYEDPLDFRPDRWTEEFEAELDDYAFIPFGGGRRTCIGRDFARLEAKLVLATVGQQWAFEWGREESTLTLEPEITTQTKNGLPMRLHSR